MEYFAANIRPEFLELVGKTVPEDQEAKGGGVSTGGAVLRRMVDVGHGGCHGIAKGLRNVKAIVTGIGAGNEQAVDTVIGAVRKTAFAHLVVAGIFVKETWENSGGHIGLL